MKIRSAKKILNIMKRGTDERYFDSEDGIKEDSRFLPRFGYLYKKAVVRWNKANAPSANVSVFRAILRNSKECSRCKHYKGNEFVGRCIKLHVDAESNDWCAGAFFVKKRGKHEKTN